MTPIRGGNSGSKRMFEFFNHYSNYLKKTRYQPDVGFSKQTHELTGALLTNQPTLNGLLFCTQNVRG